MYEALTDVFAAQESYSKNMIDSLPNELHGAAVDLLTADNPIIKQIVQVAYHNGREAAYHEMRETVNGAVAQAHQWREKLRYIYEHVSDEAKAEIGALLNDFNTKNNN